MALLFALIFRAASIEFRSKVTSPAWRQIWDMSFFGSSLLATFLFGVSVGDAMVGFPLNERVFTGTALDMLKPYPLLVGVLAVTMFAMHGSLYLYLKVPKGDLHKKMGSWVWHAWGVFLVVYLLTTIYTFLVVPRAIAHFREWPWAFVLVIANVLAFANIPRRSSPTARGRRLPQVA